MLWLILRYRVPVISEIMKTKKDSQNSYSNKNENNSDKKTVENYVFWEINSKTGNIKILPSRVYDLLQAYGVAKYYPGGRSKNVKPVTVLIKQNIIEPVGKDFMLSMCKAFINFVIPDEQTKSAVIDALHRSTSIFSETNQFLVDAKEVDTVEDTADSSYFFFKNSAVRVTTDNIELIPYDQLSGCVWKSNIIDFNIKLEDASIVSHQTVFFKFLMDITRKTNDVEGSNKRLAHLFSLIGYMLHRYKSFSEARAVIIMDENPSFSPEGGTGKSMIFKAIARIRVVVIEPGRTFDPASRFAFQKIDESVDLLLVDDAAANFNFDKLFSHITEDFSIEEKFVKSKVIAFADAPKIAVTTNYSVNDNGGSYKRRKYEFEISKYYGEGYSPETKYGHTFFQEWDEKEWTHFHNFMFLAAQYFLKNGVVKSEPINLNRTHLINATTEEFADFADENINLNVEYNKKLLLQQFISLYPSYSLLTPRTFTSWLKSYASTNGYKIVERHSNAVYYVTFLSGEEKDQPPLRE